MKTKNFFWGLFFILAAAFIIFNQIGLDGELSFLKLAGGILFLGIAIEGCLHRSFTKVIFSLAFLGIIFSSELGIQSLTPWPILLVALLLSIGVSIIFPKYGCNWHGFCGCSGDIDDNVEILEDDSEIIKCYSKFGGATKYITSDNFKQADILCHFGAMKAVFNNANIEAGVTPVIRLDCSFSGVELHVPYNWRIENQVSSSFGAVEEKNHESGNDIVTVKLVGNASFCGVEIIHIYNA